MEAQVKPGRLSSLDGWRALSILMVLGAHSTFTAGFSDELRPLFLWVFDGALGVRFFFCISGFLITYLMLQEAERTGRMSLRDFYARRALRILPVYFLFLAVLFGLQCATPLKLTAGQWVSSLTFTADFVAGQWLNGHLWSLAVEEQFYLLWPVLFVTCELASRWRRALLALALPVVLAPVLRVAGYLHWLPPTWQWLVNPFSFLLHCDALGMGCGAAFLLHGHAERVRAWLCLRPGLVCAAALGAIVIPSVLARLFLAGFFTVPLTPACQALGFVILMVQSVLRPDWGMYRLLNSAAACQLGVLSYSLYIWQQLFCASPATFGLHQPWWLSFPGWLVPALAVAALSYHAFERPFLSLRARFRHAAPVTPDQAARPRIVNQAP